MEKEFLACVSRERQLYKRGTPFCLLEDCSRYFVFEKSIADAFHFVRITIFGTYNET